VSDTLPFTVIYVKHAVHESGYLALFYPIERRHLWLRHKLRGKFPISHLNYR